MMACIDSWFISTLPCCKVDFDRFTGLWLANDTACMPAAANGTQVTETGMPEDSEDDSSITPEDTTLFTRQIAADNTSMVTNYSSWIPQASHDMPECGNMNTICTYYM